MFSNYFCNRDQFIESVFRLTVRFLSKRLNCKLNASYIAVVLLFLSYFRASRKEKHSGGYVMKALYVLTPMMKGQKFCVKRQRLPRVLTMLLCALLGAVGFWECNRVLRGFIFFFRAIDEAIVVRCRCDMEVAANS